MNKFLFDTESVVSRGISVARDQGVNGLEPDLAVVQGRGRWGRKREGERLALAVKEDLFQHWGTSGRVWCQGRWIWGPHHLCPVQNRAAREGWYRIISYHINLSVVDVSKESEKIISEQRCLLTCLLVTIMNATSWGDVFRKSKK